MYQVLFYHATLRYQFLCRDERYHCKITIFFIFSTISLACINVLKCLEMFEMQYIFSNKIANEIFWCFWYPLTYVLCISTFILEFTCLCTCNLIQEVHVHHASCGQNKEISYPKSGILVKTNTCTCNFYNLSWQRMITIELKNLDRKNFKMFIPVA